jgi:hypothetical protein
VSLLLYKAMRKEVPTLRAALAARDLEGVRAAMVGPASKLRFKMRLLKQLEELEALLVEQRRVKDLMVEMVKRTPDRIDEEMEIVYDEAVACSLKGDPLAVQMAVMLASVEDRRTALRHLREGVRGKYAVRLQLESAIREAEDLKPKYGEYCTKEQAAAQDMLTHVSKEEELAAALEGVMVGSGTHLKHKSGGGTGFSSATINSITVETAAQKLEGHGIKTHAAEQLLALSGLLCAARTAFKTALEKWTGQEEDDGVWAACTKACRAVRAELSGEVIDEGEGEHLVPLPAEVSASVGKEMDLAERAEDLVTSNAKHASKMVAAKQPSLVELRACVENMAEVEVEIGVVPTLGASNVQVESLVAVLQRVLTLLTANSDAAAGSVIKVKAEAEAERTRAEAAGDEWGMEIESVDMTGCHLEPLEAALAKLSAFYSMERAHPDIASRVVGAASVATAGSHLVLLRRKVKYAVELSAAGTDVAATIKSWQEVEQLQVDGERDCGDFMQEWSAGKQATPSGALSEEETAYRASLESMAKLAMQESALVQDLSTLFGSTQTILDELKEAVATLDEARLNHYLYKATKLKLFSHSDGGVRAKVTYAKQMYDYIINTKQELTAALSEVSLTKVEYALSMARQLRLNTPLVQQVAMLRQAVVRAQGSVDRATGRDLDPQLDHKKIVGAAIAECEAINFSPPEMEEMRLLHGMTRAEFLENRLEASREAGQTERILDISLCIKENELEESGTRFQFISCRLLRERSDYAEAGAGFMAGRARKKELEDGMLRHTGEKLPTTMTKIEEPAKMKQCVMLFNNVQVGVLLVLLVLLVLSAASAAPSPCTPAMRVPSPCFPYSCTHLSARVSWATRLSCIPRWWLKRSCGRRWTISR